MSLEIVTGLPGSGKTSLVVDWLAFSDRFKGRPLFVMGIPELKLEHQPVPPVEQWTELRPSEEDPSILLPYFTFPPNAVIVLDEGQRIFRPRPTSSKVPDHVAAFETHRHCGIDFIVMTQHPNLLDTNLRRLAGRHFHVHIHALGRELLEWPKASDVESRTERALASRSKYAPPKRAFALYKSAEAHTVIKRKLPKAVYVVAIGLVLMVGLGWYAVQRISSRMAPTEPASAEVSPGRSITGGITSRTAQHAQQNAAPPKTAAQYVASMMPRIPDMPYTAPAYDAVTQPQEAPYPVGCVQSKSACKCIDQQGNRYATSDALCRSFVQDGLFVAFKRQQKAEPVKVATVGKGGALD